MNNIFLTFELFVIKIKDEFCMVSRRKEGEREEKRIRRTDAQRIDPSSRYSQDINRAVTS